MPWIMMADQTPAMAQTSARPTAPTRPPTGSSSAYSAAFDLTSTQANVSAQSLFGTSLNSKVILNSGGTALSVTGNSMLTPAQYAAAAQVLQSSRQTLFLSGAGNATGGTLGVSPTLAAQMSRGLAIPQGVTVYKNFADSPIFALNGDLVNAGTFLALSTAIGATNQIASIVARNITNLPTGVITTVAPANGISGLPNLAPILDLSLIAAGALSNKGAIISSGNLSLSAGQSIINDTALQGAGQAHALLSAAGNLSIQAPNVFNAGTVQATVGSINVNTASLVNTGLMEAMQGSLSIGNLTSNQLSITNIGGIFRAGEAIAFSTAPVGPGSAAIALNGGVLDAPKVLFTSPSGSIDIAADQITGGIYVSGEKASIGVKTGDLKIASMCLTGDPIYYNSGGNVDLSGLFTTSAFSTFGGDFVVLAAGNIVAPTAPVSATVDATNSTGIGGRIDLEAGVTFNITGATNCTNCAGSYSVTGNSATGGDIVLPTISLRTNGNSVLLNSHAGSSALGSITVQNLESSGAGGAVATSGQAAGNITIAASSNITTGSIRAYGGGGGGSTGYYGGNNVAGNGGAGGAISINSLTGALSVNGDINTSGGGGGGGGSLNRAGGNAGTIDVNAAGAVAISGPVLAVGGGAGSSFVDGGGSFGGGGGAAGSDERTSVGGGGFFGGGGTEQYSRTGSAGGGIFGGGAGVASAESGAAGYGGRSAGTYGSTFGTSGATGGWAASTADLGNAVQGSSANVTINGSSIAVSGTVGSSFGSLSSMSQNPFTSSPYASISVAGRSVKLTAAGTTPVAVTGAIGIGDGGTLQLKSNGILATSLNSIAYMGASGGTATVSSSVAGQTLSIAAVTIFQNGGLLSLSSNGLLNIGTVTSVLSARPVSGSALQLSGANGVTVGSSIFAPAGSVQISSSAGSITTQNIDVSGIGGLATLKGGDAGSITLSAAGTIQTGLLRAYGGGGGGSAGYYGGNNNPGAGGVGGAISITAGGAVTVNGDINVSGGGGGGGGGAGGAAGGNAGSLTISTSSAVSISGPVLAIGGGGGGLFDGGSSFGGGGGAAGNDERGNFGGSGLFGGGGIGQYNRSGSDGGGSTGAGAGAGGGQSGSAGYGGSGDGSYGTTFGAGSVYGSTAGSTGCCLGGAAGTNGDITIQGSSVSVNGTVQSAYAGLSALSTNPFSTSPFANTSVAGRNISLTATGAIPVSTAGQFVLGSGGTLTVTNSGTLQTSFSDVAFIGRPGGSSSISGGAGQPVSITKLTLFGNGGTLNIGSQNTLNIGSITGTYGSSSSGASGGSALVLTAVQDLTLGNVNAPGSDISLTSSSGKVTTASIDVSGYGGLGVRYGNAYSGQRGGNVTISASGDVQTSFIRTYGGGGGSLTLSNAGQGGNGGAGGTLSMTSASGAITVNGDINTSGGGGGGSGRFGYNGGAGGAAGSVTLHAPGSLTVTGPILASGGGGGAGDGNSGGGGSFGGGGAASSAAGGGGFYGGGQTSGYGGTANGGGYGGGGSGGNGGASGTLGGGGGGSAFGVGGFAAGSVGATGYGALGGLAGASGDVDLQGASISVAGTVSSQFGGLSTANPNPFTTSPYATVSISGRSVNLTTTSSTPYSVAGMIAIGDSGSLNAQAGGAVITSLGSIGYIGSSTGSASVVSSAAGQALNISAITLFQGTGTLNVSSQGALTIGSLLGSVTSTLFSCGTLNGTAVQDITISGAISAPGTNLTLTSTTGAVTTGNIDIAGNGGSGGVYYAFAGQNGGAVTVSAVGAVQTGYIRTYGGGGGSITYSNAAIGGNGGAGGAVSLTSSSATVTVNGDLNTSGGGGGASGRDTYTGGNGGAAGNVSIDASGSVTINGPLLSLGGGGGAGAGATGGGGSFGGGGGGSAGPGGGGFYGGGASSGYSGAGQGGGFTGGGAGASPGTIGSGGGGTYFGQGGPNAGDVGSDASSTYPGLAGTDATVSLKGTTVSVTGTVAGSLAPLSTASPNPFSTSPYANVSLAAGTITVNASSAAANSVNLGQTFWAKPGSLTITTPGSVLFAGAFAARAATKTSITITADQGINNTQAITIPSGIVALTTLNGAITTAGIDVSGIGGYSLSGAGTESTTAGGIGGTITLNANGNLMLSYLRAYGGGGYGSNVAGAAGGKGGTISVLSSLGLVNVAGDINISGGGGGGSNSATGGAGGNGGSLSISVPGTVSISGPILAAGGGGGSGVLAGSNGNGGASFGGGGGSWLGGGGGGFFGGGSMANFNSGGGILGAGNPNGLQGQGGNGSSGYTGGIFGVGGTAQNLVGQAGAGGTSGGTAGVNGGVSISGSTVSISGTVASNLASLSSVSPNPFSTSPFSNTSIYSGPTQITATSGNVAISGDVRTSQSGTAGSVKVIAQTGISIGGAIDTSSISGSGGDVSLTNSTGGMVITGGITTGSFFGRGDFSIKGFLNPHAGNISINEIVDGSVQISKINTSATGDSFGGDVVVQLLGTSALQILTTVDTTSGKNTAGNLLISGNTTGSVAFNTAGASSDVAIVTSSSRNAAFSGNVRILTSSADVGITGGILTSGSNGAHSGEIVIKANNASISGTINTSNKSASGATVDVAAQNSLTATTVNTAGGISSGVGSGGLVMMSAGISGSGSLTVGDVTTDGAGDGNSAGSLVLLAAGNSGATTSITTGNISLAGTNNARGGTASLVAGTQSTSGNISFGNVNTSGLQGGNVIAISMGATGNINGGNITTDASGTDNTAGSISISATGAVTLGNLSTQANSAGSSASYGGSILIATATANGISTGTINTGSTNIAGNVFLVLASGTGSTGTVSLSGGDKNGFLFNGTPNPVVPNDINSDMTVSFNETTGVSNYRPGGFLTANASSVTLTVDTNGDARLFVPIVVLNGDVSLANLVSLVTNGAASPLSMYANGNISILGSVSASSTNAPAPPVSVQSNLGSVSLQSVSVAGNPGGSIVISSPTQFTLANGQSLVASSSTGLGGQILIAVPNGTANLGSSGNSSSNVIDASGVTGGLVQIEAANDVNDYGVLIKASGTTGVGGTIRLAAFEGSVNLYNYHAAGNTYNASIDASSSGNTGGTISIYGKYGVTSAIDPASTTSNAPSQTITAAGVNGNGGTVTINSPEGNINLGDTMVVSASSSGASYTGGSVNYFAPVGTVTSNAVDVSGSNGGSIVSASTNFILNNSFDMSAAGVAGAGGSIEIYTAGVKVNVPGYVQLGQVGNTTDNKLSANGTTTGGTINVFAGVYFTSNEVSMTATGGTGNGGTVSISAYGGDTTFVQQYALGINHYANIDTSSMNANGGTIQVASVQSVVSSRQGGSGCCGGTNASTFAANGPTAGGTIQIQALQNVDLSELQSATALSSGPGATAGTITVSATDAATLTSLIAKGDNGGSVQATGASVLLPSAANVDASGSNGAGGTVTITASQTTLQLGSLNNQSNNYIAANGTTTGGSITMSGTAGVTNFEVSISATGGTGNGGSINISSTGGNIALYTEYFGSSNYNPNLDVSSVAAKGGTISLTANAGSINSMQDTTVTGGNTTTARMTAGGANGGTITISAASGFDLRQTETVDASTNAGGNGGAIAISASGATALGFLTKTAALGAAGTITSSSGSTLTITSNLDSPSIALSTSSNGDIVINADSNGSTGITLAANGSGNIIRNAGTLTGSAVTLSSASGSIGTLAAPIQTAGSTLQANTTGNVYINQLGAVTMLASSGGNNFQITDDADISLGNTITASNILIQTTAASNGNISISANPTASSSLTLNAGGAGNIAASSGTTLSAPTMNLISGSGLIGSSSTPLRVSTNWLTVNSTGSAYVSSTGGLTLQNSAVGPVFDLTVNGAITLTNTLTGQLVNISTTPASNGNIVVNQNPSANTLNLYAGGSGTITAGVSFNQTNVNLRSDTGALVGLNSSSPNLSLNTSGAVSVTQSASVNLGSSSGSTFTFVTTNNSNVALAGTLTGTASVAINANGSGAITQSLGTIQTPALTLISSSGTIGPLTTSAATLTANTTGDVTITDTGSLTLGTSTGNTLSISTQAGGDVRVAGNVAATNLILNANGSGAISQTAGTVQATSLSLISGSGNISLTSTASNLAANTTGDVSLTNSGNAVVNNSSGNSFQLTNTGDVNVVGALTVDSLNLATTAASNGAVTVDSAVASANGIVITTGGSGALTINNVGGSLAGHTVTLNTTSLVNDGSVSAAGAGAATVDVTSSGSLSVAGAGTITSSSGGVSAVRFNTGAGGALTVDGSLSVAAGNNGTLAFNAASNGQSITFANNSATTLGGGSSIFLNSPTVNFGTGATVSSPLNSNVTFSNATGALTIKTNTGGGASLNTTGTITLSPAAGQSISFDATGAGNADLALNGSQVIATASAINIGANMRVSSNAQMSLATPLIDNAGTLTSSVGIAINVAPSATIQGAGTIAGAGLSVTSTTGAVTISQGQISAPVSASAAQALSLVTSNGNLNVLNLSANNGTLSAAANGGTLSALDGGTVSASRDISLRGLSGVNIGTPGGTGVHLLAGRVLAGYVPRSTNMSDYDTSKFASTGGVFIDGQNGDINIGDNNVVQSLGNSIGMTTAGDFNFGANNDLFAQGGNIWINGLKSIQVANGSSFTAIARSVTNGGTVTIDNTTLPQFVGGDIAFDVSALHASYDQYLRNNFDMNRVASGSISLAPAATLSGVAPTVTNGGSIVVTLDNKASVSISAANQFSANGAVIYIDPLGISNVTLTGVSFNAVGPSLNPPPPPPAPSGTPLVPSAPTSPVAAVPAPPTTTITGAQIEVKQTTLLTASAPPPVPRDVINWSASVPSQSVVSSGQVSQQEQLPPGGQVVYLTSCQPFLLRSDDNAYVVGDAGSALSTTTKDGKQVLTLEKGKLLVGTEGHSVEVQTAKGSLSVPPMTMAVIEETNGVIRVINISGTSAEVSNSKGTIGSVEPGQEICWADESASDEDLIPTDGLDRCPVVACVVVSGSKMQKSKLASMEDFLDRDKLLRCNSYIDLKKRAKSSWDADHARPQALGPQASSRLKPIAMTPESARKQLGLHHFSTETLQIVNLDGKQHIVDGSNQVDLRFTQSLICPARDLQLNTSKASLQLRAGSVAQIEDDGHTTAVRLLWDLGGTSVNVCGQQIELTPGEEFILTDLPEPSVILNKSTIARRNIRASTAGPNETFMRSEFSLAGLLTGHKLMTALEKSDDEADRALVAKVMKMAVTLSIVTNRKGAYSTLGK